MSFWNKIRPFETEYRPTESSEYYWRFKAPTVKVEEEMAAYITENAGSLTTPEVAVKELARTFAGSNFPDPNSPTTDPYNPDFIPALSDDATPEDVERYLRESGMPSALMFELWKKMKEVAPHWGPEFPRPDSE